MSLTTNLLSYYKLDENTGTTVGDSAGTNGGTFSGTGTLWATGIINSGGNFVGANSTYVDIAGFNNTISYSAFSISLWVKISGFGANGRIAANSHTDVDNKGFQMYYTNSAGIERLRFDVGNGSTHQFSESTGGAISTATWYHCVGIFDGSNVNLYLNNVQQTVPSLTGSIGAQTLDLNLGRNPAYAGDYMDGVVDEVGIWNRALTPTEVASLYNSGSGLQ